MFETLTRLSLNSTVIPKVEQLSKGKVLDVGALHSPYKKHTDFDEYYILDIEERENVDYVEDIHNTSLQSNTFDTIIATEVLEHLYNPRKATKEMHRLLKKEGVLIASTRFIYPYHGTPNDFFRFTRYALEKIFTDFSSVTIIPHGNRIFAILDLLTTSNKILKLLRLINPLLVKFPHKSHNTKVPLGFVIIAVK